MDIETLTAATRAARAVQPAPLVGTDRQIAWAEEIRRQALAVLAAEADTGTVEDATQKLTAGQDATRSIERALGADVEWAHAETGLRSVTSAEWWIRNRGKAGDAMQLWQAGRTLARGGNPA